MNSQEPVPVYEVNAFCRGQVGGNAAGVVLHAEGLSEASMQGIAACAGFSETAFVTGGTDGFTVRFFTPTKEVALCGHATVASFHLLREVAGLGAGTYTLQTGAGPQRICVEMDGRIWMTQNPPSFGEHLKASEVCESLSLKAEQIGTPAGLPVGLASTGLWKIFVPVESLETLRQVRPNLKAIEKTAQRYGAIGMYVFCLESLGGATAHCRNFAPVVGIQEDAATGTSAAALACYLAQQGVLGGADEPEVPCSFEQGDILGQPSQMDVRLEQVQGETSAVWVGGYGATIRVHQMKQLEAGFEGRLLGETSQ